MKVPHTYFDEYNYMYQNIQGHNIHNIYGNNGTRIQQNMILEQSQICRKLSKAKQNKKKTDYHSQVMDTVFGINSNIKQHGCYRKHTYP